MVLELRKTTHDDRTDTPRILDEYGKPTSGSRIVLLGKPVTLQERAPLQLCLDGHVEGAVVEALDDCPLAANPLGIVWCCPGQGCEEQLLAVPGNLNRNRKGDGFRTLVDVAAEYPRDIGAERRKL